MKSFAAGAALGKLFDNEINKMEAAEKMEKFWEKQEKEKAKFKEKMKKMLLRKGKLLKSVQLE